ncbi:MAG: glucose-6-phosphate dehydrogenase, partial [Actinomycetes bacterium]
MAETMGKDDLMALRESDRLVIFGITGDLAKKMTLPSLYRLERRGMLNVPVVTVAANDWTIEQLVAHARECVLHVEGSLDEEVFARFVDRLTYLHSDFRDPQLYADLAAALQGAVAPTFYLEIPPQLFVVVAQQISAAGLLGGDARIIFEKPFGTSLQTAVALNKTLHTFMREDQIFRLDHYLGKEPVLDLMYMRFGNTWFEPTWNNHYVDCIMITMAEDFGVQDRGSFYDKVGTIRDVVQNHLLQVLALTTMEIPVADFSAPRYNIFKAIPDVEPHTVVRGQYEGYLDTPGVAPDSTTETFVALKLYIDSWRWAGVPVFIRAGKNLPVKATEVVIRMKKLKPILINGKLRGPVASDDIVLRVGNDSGVTIAIQVKSPGHDALEPIQLGVDFKSALGDVPEPYELLLTSAMSGDRSFFPDENSVEETWRIVQPIIDDHTPPTPYKPGSWGPHAAVN